MTRKYIATGSSKKHRKDNSAKKRRANWSSVGADANFSDLAEFVSTTSVARRQSIVENLEQNGRVRDIVTVGSMCLELARDNRQNASEWLGRASVHLIRGSELYSVGGNELFIHKIKAERLLSSMPHFYSMFLENKLPGKDWTAKMSARIKHIGQETLTRYGVAVDEAINDESKFDFVGQIKGEMAEQAVHLLCLRAGEKFLDSSTWATAPSYCSEENQALATNNPEIRSWDLTGFTHNSSEKEPESTYLIQVKSRRPNADDTSCRIYAPDITMLYFSEHLRLSHEKWPLGPKTVMKELLHEYEDRTYAKRLDLRTELLLETLG